MLNEISFGRLYLKCPFKCWLLFKWMLSNWVIRNSNLLMMLSLNYQSYCTCFCFQFFYFCYSVLYLQYKLSQSLFIYFIFKLDFHFEIHFYIDPHEKCSLRTKKKQNKTQKNTILLLLLSLCCYCDAWKFNIFKTIKSNNLFPYHFSALFFLSFHSVVILSFVSFASLYQTNFVSVQYFKSSLHCIPASKGFFHSFLNILKIVLQTDMLLCTSNSMY